VKPTRDYLAAPDDVRNKLSPTRKITEILEKTDKRPSTTTL
jgi:hypothetical protein